MLWLVINSYAFTSLTPVWCEVNVISFFLSSFLFFIIFLILFMFDIVFFLCCYLLFVFIYSFLVIQSDLENIFKNCDENFHCKHVLIVKDYGKLGILYDEKLGGFIGDKKEDLFP